MGLHRRFIRRYDDRIDTRMLFADAGRKFIHDLGDIHRLALIPLSQLVGLLKHCGLKFCVDLIVQRLNSIPNFPHSNASLEIR